MTCPGGAKERLVGAVAGTFSITQDEADDAAAEAAAFWPEFGRRWPWTRQRSLIPVYKLIGETTVSLLRAFPAIQRSNQARWYRRIVRDTPAIYALFPEAFAEEARRLLGGADPREIEGKQVVSFIYLTSDDAESPEGEVAKTLLATTENDAPYYTAQLAHELLNCFCATSWDGRTLRSGARRAGWGAGAMLQQGGALNDLLLDTLLLAFLPRWTDVTRAALLEGLLGPYWGIVELFQRRLAGLPVHRALFDPDEEAQPAFEQGLDAALGLLHATFEVDRLLARHDWARLRDVGTMS
jgi:hypothetical protein